MEILELHLKHFGKFTDYRLKLHSGVNIISGGNETGKSTLHAFIRAMFYGLSRNRSRNLDEYQLRQPWDNPDYFAGSLRLLFEEKIYRIERNFNRSDESLRVICETDGTEAEDARGMLDAFTGKLSDTDFDNTFFIRQAGSSTSRELGEHLRDFLVNIEQTGDANLDVNAAVEALKKKRSQINAARMHEAAELDEKIRRNLEETEFIRTELEQLTERQNPSGEEPVSGASPAFERIRDGEVLHGKAGDPAAEAGAGASERIRDGEVLQGKAGGPATDAGAGASERIRDGEALYGKAGEPAAEAGASERIRDGEVLQGKAGETDEDEKGGLLLPVLVLLSFAAGILVIACAVRSPDHLLRWGLSAAGAVLLLLGSRFVWELRHPLGKAERAVRQVRREEFLEKHFGFRDDPDDPDYGDQRRRILEQRREKIRRAREEEELEKRRRLEKTLKDQEEADQRERAREVARMLEKEKVRDRDGEKTEEAQTEASAEPPEELPVQPPEESPKESPDALRRERASGKREELRRQIRVKQDRLQILREELEKLYSLKGSLSAYDVELQAIDLASARISELAGRIYHESGDRFSSRVSELLSALTEGRYNSVSLDERMQLRISTRDHLLQISQVSYGTMEQVYFALRLAAGELLAGGTGIPAVLDEPFVMYDDERLEQALRYLHSSGRQVILFTCQRRELDILAAIRA